MEGYPAEKETHVNKSFPASAMKAQRGDSLNPWKNQSQDFSSFTLELQQPTPSGTFTRAELGHCLAHYECRIALVLIQA